MKSCPEKKEETFDSIEQGKHGLKESYFRYLEIGEILELIHHRHENVESEKVCTSSCFI